jgi:hypothetical protein
MLCNRQRVVARANDHAGKSPPWRAGQQPISHAVGGELLYNSPGLVIASSPVASCEHGKQGRAKARSQKAQETNAETGCPEA